MVSTVFYQVQRRCSVYQDIYEHFALADELYVDNFSGFGTCSHFQNYQYLLYWLVSTKLLQPCSPFYRFPGVRLKWLGVLVLESISTPHLIIRHPRLNNAWWRLVNGFVRQHLEVFLFTPKVQDFVFLMEKGQCYSFLVFFLPRCWEVFFQIKRL